jgi:hypothetical protein
MISGVQPKVLLTQDEDGNLKLDDYTKQRLAELGLGDDSQNDELDIISRL